MLRTTILLPAIDLTPTPTIESQSETSVRGNTFQVQHTFEASCRASFDGWVHALQASSVRPIVVANCVTSQPIAYYGHTYRPYLITYTNSAGPRAVLACFR